MLEFLKKENISDETIDYINNNFSGNEIMALSDNEEECLKTIALLKRIGIENIEDLLMHEVYIFLKTTNKVYSELSKYDFTKLISEINDDYVAIEKYI